MAFAGQLAADLLGLPYGSGPRLLDTLWQILWTMPFVACFLTALSAIIAGIIAAVLGNGAVRRDGIFNSLLGSAIFIMHWFSVGLFADLLN
ncbi:MAG: hypothetical protein ISS72_06635 [Candidatus Brocadiae bacterium]|nr:hypothetical protein [Candidatus Brocadiia bacterium]